jgi:hypothetical protein
MLASRIRSTGVQSAGNARRFDRGVQVPYEFDFAVGIVLLVLESDLPLRTITHLVFVAKWRLAPQVDGGL